MRTALAVPWGSNNLEAANKGNEDSDSGEFKEHIGE